MNQKIRISICLWLIFLTAPVLGQNEFQPQRSPQVYQAPNQSWDFPNTRQPIQQVAHTSVADVSQDFPKRPISSQFPPAPVSFDSEPTQDTSSAEPGMALGATLEHAAEKFQKLKKGLAEKSSGILDSIGVEKSSMEKFQSFFGGADLGKMLGSLALVLGGYFGLVWVFRTFNGASRALPTEVLEVMGHAPYGPKQSLQLVRLGSKLLLLINGPDGTQPVGEITDPVEVEYLSGLCPGTKRSSVVSASSIRSAVQRRERQTNIGIGASLSDVLDAIEGGRRERSFEA